MRLRVRIYCNVGGGTGSLPEGLDSFGIVCDIFIDIVPRKRRGVREKLFPRSLTPLDFTFPIDDFSVVPC